MPFDFLTPRIDRLGSDGSLYQVHPGTALGRLLRRPVLLLARDLCSFGLFQSANLPKSRRRQAAQLHARSTAPYTSAGWKLTKAKDDFGVWWWDADRVAASLDPASLTGLAPVICPETLMQPVVPLRDETWRIVRLAQGYEAQLWRDKALVASAWRKDRYDTAAWISFVRLQRSVEAAPQQAPAPVDLPVAFDPRHATAPVELTREQALLLGGASLVTASLCVAAFVMGGSLQLKKDTEAVLAETAQIRAASPKLDRVEGLDEAQKMLVAYNQLEARTNPLSAAGAAIGIFAYHDLTPISVKAESHKVTVQIGYGIMDRLETLIEDLQTSGYFYDIRPKADAATSLITIEMAVRETAPPLGEMN